MSFFAEHWEALSSLLLSVVAIGIAIYSARKTSKDATRQIESIKELSKQTIDNTIKEVDSIKDLARMQIEALTIEMDMEMAKYGVQAERANEERKALSGIQQMNHLDVRDMMMKDYQAEQPLRDMKYIARLMEELRGINRRLEQLKADLK